MGKIFFPNILLFDSKLDHNSALHAKIRVKSLLLKSEGFFVLSEGEKCRKSGGNGVRRGGNAI